MNRRFRAPLALLAGASALFTMIAVPAAQAEPAPTVVSITFDDTNSDTAPALDLLKARGLKATLYVNSQRLGFNSSYLSREQLKNYSLGGFEIAGHSLNHENLADLGYDGAKQNVCADRANLINLGYKVTSFAYPFGAKNADVIRAVQDCGYNSARTTNGLRTPTSSQSLPVAESIPPLDPFWIRVPSVIGPEFTLDQVKGMVTQAENGGGGLVPLVFHHICNGCTNNSMSITDFTALVDWLQARPATTTVKTIDEVIGGAVKPLPSGDPTPEPDSVISGTQTHTITGVNILRSSGAMVLYDGTAGPTTKTNQYGTEVAIVNGVVTQLQSSVGNMAIPAGGVVLSGHGESGTWLKNNAKVGTAVTIHGISDPPPPPPPPPVVTPTTNVTIGAASHLVNGVNIYRSSGFLVVYTAANGPTTGTNEFGTEVSVVNGKITAVVDKVGNATIPANGYVLSGHGESRNWLRANAVVGATVTP